MCQAILIPQGGSHFQDGTVEMTTDREVLHLCFVLVSTLVLHQEMDLSMFQGHRGHASNIAYRGGPFDRCVEVF